MSGCKQVLTILRKSGLRSEVSVYTLPARSLHQRGDFEMNLSTHWGDSSPLPPDTRSLSLMRRSHLSGLEVPGSHVDGEFSGAQVADVVAARFHGSCANSVYESLRVRDCFSRAV